MELSKEKKLLIIKANIEQVENTTYDLVLKGKISKAVGDSEQCKQHQDNALKLTKMLDALNDELKSVEAE